MSASTFVGEIGICPIPAQWNARLEKFRQLEFSSLGGSSFTQHPQSLPLTYELEHIFCAGAWLSVIILAYSLIEMRLAEQGAKNHKERTALLSGHPLKEKIEWLRLRRNSLVHVEQDGPAVVSFDDQLFERNHLYQDAKQAIAIAFRYTLEPSKQGNANEG
jgi:hypothetical protein